jgi:hypothetical protein
MEQGPWLPAFMPQNVRLPGVGLSLYVFDGRLYVASTESNGRVLATSFVRVGGLWWIGVLCAGGFPLTMVLARALSRRFLRNYFAVTAIRVPGLPESLRLGEGHYKRNGIQFRSEKSRRRQATAAHPSADSTNAVRSGHIRGFPRICDRETGGRQRRGSAIHDGRHHLSPSRFLGCAGPA